MGLTDKRVLLFTDDAILKEKVLEAVEPLVKLVVVASNDSEAILKATNADFDCVLLRTKLPNLDDPKKFFHWSKSQKRMRLVPWIVLGKDIESDKHLVEHRNLKFLESPDDGAALLKLLEGVLYSPEKGGAAPSIDVNFVNPFVNAVVSVLDQMGGVKLTRGAPHIRKSHAAASAMGDISGLIAMNSDRFLGSMAISFEEKLILKIYQNMVGSEEKTISSDVKDAVAELTNIIFGNAKRDLNAIGHTISPALPSIVTGKNHQIHHAVDGVCIILPFECADGHIQVECVIRPKAT